MKTIIMMYITLLPPIIAGILNSIWCKTSMLKILNIPMDGGKKFTDGKRILGDHKTCSGVTPGII